MRPHTSINPEVEKLRAVYDRAPSWRDGGIVADQPTDYGIDERPRSAESPAFGQDFMNKIDQADRAAKAFLDMYLLGGGAPESVARAPWQEILMRDPGSWTDVPSWQRERSDTIRRRYYPAEHYKGNPLRNLPDPRFENIIGPGIAPYFPQHGPHQFGTGAI